MALWKTVEDEIFMGDTFNRDGTAAYCSNCIADNSRDSVIATSTLTNNSNDKAIPINDGYLSSALKDNITTLDWTSAQLADSLKEIQEKSKQLQETIFGAGKSQYEATKRENARRNKYKTLNPKYEVLK